MRRPTIDLSKGIPKSPESWEWREYATHLEAKVEALTKERDALRGRLHEYYTKANHLIGDADADEVEAWALLNELSLMKVELEREQ